MCESINNSFTLISTLNNKIEFSMEFGIIGFMEYTVMYGDGIYKCKLRMFVSLIGANILYLRMQNLYLFQNRKFLPEHESAVEPLKELK